LLAVADEREAALAVDLVDGVLRRIGEDVDARDRRGGGRRVAEAHAEDRAAAARELDADEEEDAAMEAALALAQRLRREVVGHGDPADAGLARARGDRVDRPLRVVR